MKIPCKVKGVPALVVGYASRRRGKPWVMVIRAGRLDAVRLSDVVLAQDTLPADLADNVQTLRQEKQA